MVNGVLWIVRFFFLCAYWVDATFGLFFFVGCDHSFVPHYEDGETHTTYVTLRGGMTFDFLVSMCSGDCVSLRLE